MLQLEGLRYEDVAETLAKRMTEHFKATDETPPKKTWWAKLSDEQKVFFWMICTVILVTIYGLLKFTRERRNVTGKR